MRYRHVIAWAVFLCVIPVFARPLAQQAQPRLVHLPLPSYFPLAVQARIVGQVRMELTIDANGALRSWKTMSGHPLLVRAVTDSLPQAQFTCEGCAQQEYTYSLTYEFVLPDDNFAAACAELQKTGKEPTMSPSTLDSPTHVTVRPARAYCLAVDPATPRVRSIRCLWLWRCSTQSFAGRRSPGVSPN
jgi:Gram-negative bacterial TonB protein C-terminal